MTFYSWSRERDIILYKEQKHNVKTYSLTAALKMWIQQYVLANAVVFCTDNSNIKHKIDLTHVQSSAMTKSTQLSVSKTQV